MHWPCYGRNPHYLWHNMLWIWINICALIVLLTSAYTCSDSIQTKMTATTLVDMVNNNSRLAYYLPTVPPRICWLCNIYISWDRHSLVLSTTAIHHVKNYTLLPVLRVLCMPTCVSNTISLAFNHFCPHVSICKRETF